MSKSFTDKIRSKAAENPALMFISQAEEQPQPTAPAEPKQPRRTTSKSKAEGSPLQATPQIRPASTSARPVPPRKEYKSRRLQLLIQPSLYEEIRDRAEAEGLSVNEEIHNLLRQALGE